MKRIWIFGAAMAFATSGHSQQVIDGSNKGFDQTVIDQIVAAMQPRNGLPRKVVIRDMRRAKSDPDSICGSVTVENRYGVFPDFEPFIIYAETFQLYNADICQ